MVNDVKGAQKFETKSSFHFIVKFFGNFFTPKE